MPAKSVAQRKFMGMVRATQKGEMKDPSPELKRAAKDMGAKAVNKFAKTKEKNLPQKIGEEKKPKNCGCGKDPCITYGPKKNAHKMPDGTIMPGKTHKEAYAVQAMTVVPGGADHSNTRQGSISKKKKKEDIKEFVGTAAAGTAGALTAKKGNRVRKAVGSGAGYAVGSTVGRKIGGAVGQAVGSGTVPLVGGAIGKQVGKAIGHGVGGAAGAIAGGKLASKKKKKEEPKNEEVILERQKDSDGQRLSQERGRSNYGKASIRNVRHTGEGGNAADPAERLVAMDKRHKAHKEKRGVKTKGVKEEMQLEKFSAVTKKRINKMAADKKVGKGERIGSVVGGIGGALALGALDGPLPVGDVVGGVVGSKIGGKIGKKFDKKKVQKEELKMTKKEYAKIHRDFKSDDPKKPRTTKYVPGKGTVSMPVKFVDEAAYTGPDKNDRAVIKKMDNRKFAAKLADYEKNMDPKKRQALKDKAIKGMKFVHEEGAPTMSTGSNASAAGFSSDADENGPTAGMDQPLGGTAKLKGKGPKLTKKKAKCKKSPDGINKICESTEARYLSFLVQMDDVEFIFQGKSPADVKIRLRKIYRPERLKGIKITRMLPAQVMHYYWEKRQAAM